MMKAIRTPLLAAGLLFTALVQADYSRRPITVVVQFPAGQTTDILSRALANEMARILKQSLVVDNRGGAGGIIGVNVAKGAAADGYTLLVASSGPVAINENLYKDIPYRTLRDFAQAALTGLMSGDVEMMFESGPVIMPSVEAHKLKVLAVGCQGGRDADREAGRAL